MSHLTRIRTRLTRRDADTISAPSSSAPSAALDTTAPSSSSMDGEPVSTRAPGWYTRPGDEWSESCRWIDRVIADSQTRLPRRVRLVLRLPLLPPPPTIPGHLQPPSRSPRRLTTLRPLPARPIIPPRHHTQPRPLKALIPPTLPILRIPLTLPIPSIRAFGKLLIMSFTRITGCSRCPIPRFLSPLTDSSWPSGCRSEVPLTMPKCGNGWMLVIGRRYVSQSKVGES